MREGEMPEYSDTCLGTSLGMTSHLEVAACAV
jgi:hypothetical protein